MEENKSGGNGGLDKQQPGPVEGEKINILTINMDKVTKRIEVSGTLGNKKLCYHAIAETIKTIADFEPSPIITNPPGGMAGVARRFLHRR